MSDNKIRKAIDSVEPENGAKERMYRNIMKKARQAALEEKPAEQKKKAALFVRYALPAAACLCLLVIGVARFAYESTPIQPGEEFVQGGNPFVEAESADAFKPLSITLDAPDGAQEVSYAVIDGELAEVGFALDGKSYIARASAREGDFSGLSGEESKAEVVDAKTDAILVSVSLDTRVCQKISWTNGKINYCLYGTDGADRNEVISAYKALKK